MPFAAGRWLSIATLAAAALLAFLLARPGRYPAHRPVAVVLGIAAAVNLARALLHGVLPLAVDRALYLAFPALSAGLAVELLALRWSRWAPLGRAAVAALWLAAVVAITVEAPPRRSPEAADFASAAQLAGIALQLAALVAFAVRGLSAGGHIIPDVSQTVALVLLAGDLAERAGPWLYGRPWRDWDLARWQWSVAYLTICYVQGRRLLWTKAIRAAGRRPGS